MPASINDLDNDPKARLAAFSQNLKAQAAAQGLTPDPGPPDINTPAVPAPAITPAAAQVNPTPAPAATPETPPVATSTEPATPQPDPPSTDPNPDTDQEPEAWDKDLLDIQSPSKEETVPFTLEDIGSALKIEKPLRNKAELVEHVESLRTKVRELEASKGENALDGLDDDLKEVLKVAQKKGNWKQHLGNLVGDYSNVDPVLLFDAEIEKDPRFINPQTGQRDTDAIAAEQANVPLGVKITQGNMLKQQLLNQQAQRRAQILHAAELKATEFNRSLADAAKKIPQSLSQDRFGIKLEPKHADFLYEGIRNGTLIEKHLGSKNIDISGVNSQKLIETKAKAEWAEQISKHQYSQGIVAGKKNLLKTVQNVQLNHPAAPPAPNVQGDKLETAAEKTAKFMNKNKTGPNSL